MSERRIIAEPTPNGTYRYRFMVDQLRICFTTKEQLSDRTAMKKAAAIFAEKTNHKHSYEYFYLAIKSKVNRKARSNAPQMKSYEEMVLEWEQAPGPSFVYFITDNREAFKVGKAVNIRARIASLQTANPYPLEVFASIEYKGQLANAGERFWQKTCSSRYERLMGEWFAGHPHDVIETISKHWEEEELRTRCRKLTLAEEYLRK